MLGMPAIGEPRIGHLDPMVLTSGRTIKIKLFGDRLANKETVTAKIWTSFPSSWKVDDTANKSAPNQVAFNVTVPESVPAGVGAIRVWDSTGVSAPHFVLIDSDASTAQFRVSPQQPYKHSFEVETGQSFVCETWSNRLNSDSDLIMSLYDPDGVRLTEVDDDEIVGFDPLLRFTASKTGSYSLHIHDIRWRGGLPVCLRVASNPVVPFSSSDAPLKTSLNSQRVPVELEEGQFLTIRPRTHEIGSPAMLQLELFDSNDRRVAQSGTGDTLNEALRFRSNKAGQFHVVARDLLNRDGLPFELDVSTDEAPFEVRMEDRSDWHVVGPGKQLKLKFRVTRFRYDGPITIDCPDVQLTNNTFKQKQNDIQATLTIPDDATPGSMIPLRFTATASVDDKSYGSNVRTISQLKKSVQHVAEWPDGLDGVVYIVVGKTDKK